MTEKLIQSKLLRSIDTRKHPFVMTNAFVWNWESDFWTLDTNGFTREYEIKISIQDYRQDAIKPKHLTMTGEKGPNYFYYVCPENMIKVEELEKKYGLIYVTEHELYVKKTPRKLHNNIFDDYKLLAEKYHWKWRNLWVKKYIDKEMNYDEFKEGFNLSLEKEEVNSEP